MSFKPLLFSFFISAFAFLNHAPLAADIPLIEGRFTFTPKIGIAPTTYNKKIDLHTEFSNPGVSTEGLRTAHAPFSKAFRFPFTAGFDFGYAVFSDTELFLNAEYIHAEGKKKHLYPRPALNARFEDFNQIGAYLGLRWYMDIHEIVSPFVGGKIGFVHRERLHLRMHVSEPNVKNNEMVKIKLGHSSDAFGGGLQLGFDFILNTLFSVQLMGEAETSTKLSSKKKTKSLRYETTNNNGTYTGTVRLAKSPKTTFSFPITFGCKFRF